jgi:hypothetical protein
MPVCMNECLASVRKGRKGKRTSSKRTVCPIHETSCVMKTRRNIVMRSDMAVESSLLDD